MALDDERIRVRAYYLWKARTGRNPDDALSNWLEAKAEETRGNEASSGADEKAIAILKQILREFTYDPDIGYELAWSGIPDIRQRLPLPFMVWWALILGTDCKYIRRPFEKTAWSIAFRFRGIPMRLEHGKFGISLRTPDSKKAKPLADDLVSALNRTFPIVDRILQSYSKAQIQAGNVSLANRFHTFESKYRFFRERAQQAFAQERPSLENAEYGVPVDVFKPDREGYFFASAAIDAFFSRLEYLLVAVLPFCGYDRAKEDLVDYIGSTWTTKFKRIFDIGVDRDVEPLYRRLRSIKERFRNSISHGFEKDGLSFHVHVMDQAIPAALSKAVDGLHYALFPVEESAFEDVCEVFDSMDELFERRHPRGWRFVAGSDLTIRFDEPGILSYGKAMASQEAFEDMMETQAYLETQAVNMEW